jgi:hypothetical protein
MTNLESKMTDKTQQNKGENPATLARITNTARDSEPKSRALPQADALKDRFKAGSIPLQTDFADLIDLANMGRQAVGGAEGQTGPAGGFTVSSAGLLELKPSAGIMVDDSGVGLKLKKDTAIYKDSAPLELREGGKFLGVDMGTAIEFKSNGISVKAGDGIQLVGDSVTVKAASGISVGSSGVDVKVGNGLKVTSKGLNIMLASGSNNDNGGGGQGTDGTTSGGAGGLTLSDKGIAIEPGKGIQISLDGVGIKLSTNSGLSVNEADGLKIVPEQMFQKGMVMMFAGTEAEMPKGWALCDGDGGRPDLRDRFVLGSTGFTNINQTNGKKVTGTNVAKQYIADSDAKTPDVRVTVNNHTLKISEIPAHSHYDGVRYNYDVGDYNITFVKEYGLYDLGCIGSNVKQYAKLQHYSDKTQYNLRLVESSKTGDSGEHNHTASATQSSHQHNTNVVPPYYILAFIIKV